MDNESLVGLDLVLKATGPNEGSAHVIALLDQLCMILAPDDVEGWSTVFEYLGKQPEHSGIRRFEIILGIQMCLANGIGNDQMEPIWMKTISHAAIHPISLILCDFRHPNSKRPRYFRRHRHDQEALCGIKLYQRLDTRSDCANCIWCLELPPLMILSNVLSNLPVFVGEQVSGTITEIGDAWNVPYFILRGMPELKAIGTDHVTLDRLDLSWAGRPVHIGEGTRVGGKLKVWNAIHPNGTGQKKYHPAGQFQTDMGLRWNDRNCKYYAHSLVNTRQAWKEPIILTNAWHQLMYE